MKLLYLDESLNFRGGQVYEAVYRQPHYFSRHCTQYLVEESLIHVQRVGDQVLEGTINETTTRSDQ